MRQNDKVYCDNCGKFIGKDEESFIYLNVVSDMHEQWCWQCDTRFK